MRPTLVILAVAMLAGGCASTKIEPKVSSNNYLVSYQPSTAGALAFDPPVIANQEPLDLSREGRDTQAFVGYESTSTNFNYLRVDDRQIFHDPSGNSYFERRSVSQKFNVTYR